MDQEMKYGPGGLRTIKSLRNALDNSFKNQLDRDEGAASMYQLLNLPHADLIPSIIDCAMEYYSVEDNCFKFGDKHLTITLEDVLYTTGLPITGKPVICSGSYDANTFSNLFTNIENTNIEEGKKVRQRLKFAHLIDFAKNKDIPLIERKRAVLFTISHAFIAPPSDGHGVGPSLAPLFYDVDTIDSYAWGAALLSNLYNELKKGKTGTTKHLGGNLWTMIAFFLIRVPKLRDIFGVNVSLTESGRPLLHNILESIQKKSFNHNTDAKSQVTRLFSELTNEDSHLPDEQSKFVWKPYKSTMLPARLQWQEHLVTRLAPLFFNGCVVRHKPYTSTRQFASLANFDVSAVMRTKKIKTTQLRGDHKRNLMVKYAAELKEWQSCRLAMGVRASYRASIPDNLVTCTRIRRKINPEAHEEDRDVSSDQSKRIRTPQEEENLSNDLE